MIHVQGSDPELTLHTVVVLVVEAEVVRQLPAHHQLLDERRHRDAAFPAALLRLQRHPLCRNVTCRTRREQEERNSQSDAEATNKVTDRVGIQLLLLLLLTVGRSTEKSCSVTKKTLPPRRQKIKNWPKNMCRDYCEVLEETPSSNTGHVETVVHEGCWED